MHIILAVFWSKLALKFAGPQMHIQFPDQQQAAL